MAHLSENITHLFPQTESEIDSAPRGFPDVCLLVLPSGNTLEECSRPLSSTSKLVTLAANNLEGHAVLAVLGEIGDLVEALAAATQKRT